MHPYVKYVRKLLHQLNEPRRFQRYDSRDSYFHEMGDNFSNYKLRQQFLKRIAFILHISISIEIVSLHRKTKDTEKIYIHFINKFLFHFKTLNQLSSSAVLQLTFQMIRNRSIDIKNINANAPDSFSFSFNKLAFVEQNRWTVLQIYFVPCTKRLLQLLHAVYLRVQRVRNEPALAFEIYLASDQRSEYDPNHRC